MTTSTREKSAILKQWADDEGLKKRERWPGRILGGGRHDLPLPYPLVRRVSPAMTQGRR